MQSYTMQSLNYVLRDRVLFLQLLSTPPESPICVKSLAVEEYRDEHACL
jgi:hypothetical protein